MLFYYESNERLPLFKRLIDTFKKGALIFICIICYFVITGFTAREVSIPEEESISIMRIPNHICTDGKPCHKYVTTMAEHLMIASGFIGYLLFIL